MPELLSFATLFISFFFILVFLRYFRQSGLYVYSIIAVIVSNMQILKLTQYSFLDNPIALGTVVFSTTFAVDNILTEYFGPKAARKCVYLCFLSYLFFIILMRVAVLHPKIYAPDCLNLHSELAAIFSPSFRFFSSSLISYLACQLWDIQIFSLLKKLFKEKFLWIRSAISISISTFFDNFIFSIFAWIIFSDAPIDWKIVWHTYILNAYILRLCIAVMCAPIVKFAGTLMRRKDGVQKF